MFFIDDEKFAQGVWKLVDFDSARFIDQDRTLLAAENATPEVAAKHLAGEIAKARPEMDIFALGMLMYYMVTRETYWTTVDITNDEQMLMMLASVDELVVSNNLVQSMETSSKSNRASALASNNYEYVLHRSEALITKNSWLTGVTNPEVHKMFDKLDRIQRSQEEINSKITTVGKFIESQQQQTGKQMADMLNELCETKRLILSVNEAIVPRGLEQSKVGSTQQRLNFFQISNCSQNASKIPQNLDYAPVPSTPSLRRRIPRNSTRGLPGLESG
ncbi:hypothetical protein BC937DRAFT_93896 [Endogone sp. FLAS-F59071]|nr:hypothetical protein BC937DRAFT_93896 [Endogone sp. FLAS-F59071]|eukprot:RUS20990.1 hypothetical protein BC937DRAFT_93896 [Endogone sp. FLAS-F59071]